MSLSVSLEVQLSELDKKLRSISLTITVKFQPSCSLNVYIQGFLFGTK